MLGRGNVMLAQERYDEALANYDKALAAKPNSADCLTGRGFALRALKRFAPAAESFERALALDPGNADAWLGRATVLMELRRFAEAAASFDKVLAARPDFAEAYYGRGRVLQALRRYDDALADFDTALAMQPFFADCLYAYGNLLREQNRLEEAAQAFERLYDFAPDHDFPQGHAALHEDVLRRLGPLRRARRRRHLGRPDRAEGDGALRLSGRLELARRSQALRRSIFAERAIQPRATPVWTGERYSHDQIRIGYVAGEFRYQATSILMAELFERHDKSRFAVYAFDNGWDDGSALRKRIDRGLRRGRRHREPRRRGRGRRDPTARDRRSRRSQRLFRAGADRRVRAAAGSGAGQLPRLSRHARAPTTSTTSSPTRS